MNMQDLFQPDFFLQVLTTGRLWSIIAGLLGLTGIIIGRIALARTVRHPNSARVMGIIAFVLGLIGIVFSVSHLASTSGGFGTGKGRAGAIVALVLGLTGMVLGAMTLARLRRIAKNRHS